jgi:hypothetical protein
MDKKNKDDEFDPGDDYSPSEDVYALSRPGRLVDGVDLDSSGPELPRGLGPDSGGQSGDTMGLPGAEIDDSESVEELLEEGQSFEAGIVYAIETTPDADKGPIRTREVPEDDVPVEYDTNQESMDNR